MNHFVEGELLLFLSDSCIEYYVQQKVAQFLFYALPVALGNGVGKVINFL
jgi:membrane protein YqaA with SNARE-associated domain